LEEEESCKPSENVHIIVSAPYDRSEKTHTETIPKPVHQEDRHEARNQQQILIARSSYSLPPQNDIIDEEFYDPDEHEYLERRKFPTKDRKGPLKERGGDYDREESPT
jgi:hypothetical protein